MDKKKSYDMGKQDGLKWSNSNKDSIEDALKWKPTSGNSDPRENPCKIAADHFTFVMDKYPEFEMKDYENEMPELLKEYYKGWKEGLNQL